VFILEGLKVVCFVTVLQVFILKVDSGGGVRLTEFCADSIFLQAIFPGAEGRKGVRRRGWYFMGYHTIWLASVKKFFGSVLGIGEAADWAFLAETSYSCFGLRSGHLQMGPPDPSDMKECSRNDQTCAPLLTPLHYNPHPTKHQCTKASAYRSIAMSAAPGFS
jgi:hypothetical protein